LCTTISEGEKFPLFLLFLRDYEKGVDIRGDAMPTQSAVTLKHYPYHGHESSLIILLSPLSR
jgi:hypothetical protein